jgi:hypothetical protein
MSLVLQSSGGGQITIQEPTTASNFTQTLPAASGEVMVTGNMPAFSAYQTAGSQTFANATNTKIIFNTEEFDTANAFDNITNYRFNPQIAGYYQLNVSLAVPTASRGTECQLAITKNGSLAKTGIDILATNTYVLSMSALIYLNGSTDYLEAIAYLGVGGITASSNIQNTYFQGFLVRAA